MLADRAWELIVDAAPGGLRGRRFAMSSRTAAIIERERRRPLITLYAVPVRIDDRLSLGRIELR